NDQHFIIRNGKAVNLPGHEERFSAKLDRADDGHFRAASWCEQRSKSSVFKHSENRFLDFACLSFRKFVYGEGEIALRRFSALRQGEIRQCFEQAMDDAAAAKAESGILLGK